MAAAGAAVAASVLAVFLRVQLNLVGRYLYLDLAFETAQVGCPNPAQCRRWRRMLLDTMDGFELRVVFTHDVQPCASLSQHFANPLLFYHRVGGGSSNLTPAFGGSAGVPEGAHGGRCVPTGWWCDGDGGSKEPSTAPTWPGAGRAGAESARGVVSRQAERPPQLSKGSQHRFLAYADFLSQKGLARLLPALHQCVAEALHECVAAPVHLTPLSAKACVDCTYTTRLSALRDRAPCFACPVDSWNESETDRDGTLGFVHPLHFSGKLPAPLPKERSEQ